MKLALVLAAAFGGALVSCGATPSETPAAHPPSPTPDAAPPPTVPGRRFDYPATRRDTVSDNLHGTLVSDPYRWLEGEDPSVQAWFEDQDRRARRQLGALHGVAARWDEMLALWQKLPPAPVRPRAGRTLRRAPEGLFAGKVGGAERLLFDARTLDATTRITRFFPSRDGRYVAMELSKNGADRRTVRTLDADSGAVLDELDGIESTEIVWWNNGFFYSFTPGDVPHATRLGERSVRFHTPGSAQPKDRAIVPASHEKDAAGIDPVAVTEDGAALLVADWSRASLYALVDLRSRARTVIPLTTEKGEAPKACVLGSSVFASVRRPDGAFDVVRVRDPRKPFEVVGHADARLIGLDTVGKYLVLTHARGPSVSRELFDADFRLVAKRETPAGTSEELAPDGDGEAVWVTREGLRTPPERLSFQPKSGTESVDARVSVPFTAADYVIDTLEAASKDGTRVPITVLRRASLALDGTAPLWTYVYGGFRVSAEQMFYPPWVDWAVHGGVFAICHARGGLEYGEAWHTGGARRSRPRTVEDVAACLEEIHRRRYSTPARTMLQGWSHGGMLVSAVAVARPDLERVVLAMVPLADMVRFPLFGRGGVNEYGDPDDPDDFAALYSFSPYHRIQRGVSYPAFLITASSQDERVAPLHARKLAAALQDASTGAEVLLRVNWGAGHHGGGAEDSRRVFAEATMFALKELGL